MSDTTNFVDLSQFEEPIAGSDEKVFDPNATGGSFRPVPEDTYVGRLSFASDKVDEQWSVKKDATTGKPQWLHTALRVEILEGDYEGRKVRDGYVSTMVMNDGSTAVNKILHALGQPVTAEEIAQHGAHKAQAIKLNEVLAGEPTVRITTQWQAKFLVEGDNGKKVTVKTHDDKKNKEVDLMLRGANKSSWPKDDKGSPRHEFTLGEAFKDAPAEASKIPAVVDAVINRYAAAV